MRMWTSSELRWLTVPMGTASCRVPVARAGVDLPPEDHVASGGMSLGLAQAGRRRVALRPQDVRLGVREEARIGSGKTVALAAQALSLIELGMDVSTVVIDPKDGMLIRYILERIPRQHFSRVHLIEPHANDRSPGVNVLGGVAPELRQETAAQLVDIITGLFPGAVSARQRYLLYNAAHTLAHHREATICDLPDVLELDQAQAYWTRGVEDLGLEEFWDWMRSMDPRERQKAIEPLLYKLRSTFMDRRVRELFGQPRNAYNEGVQMPEHLDPLETVLEMGGILLVNLPSLRMGEEMASMTASFLLQRIWQLVGRRESTSEHQRKTIACFIDEFPMVARLGGPLLSRMLTQARGYGLGLILAGQYSGQLRDLEEAVRTNVGTEISWTIKEEDQAREVAKRYPDVEPRVLQSLGRYQAIIRPTVNGQLARPFTARVEPPQPWDPDDADLTRRLSEHAEELRRYSLERWGRPREEIEAELRERRRRITGAGVAGEDGGYELA